MAADALTHLDTHAAAFVAMGEMHRFSAATQQHLAGRRCAVSPMVRLELTYLYDIGRLTFDGNEVCRRLAELAGIPIDDAGFDAVITQALSLAWTRDPFDRIITAHARAAGAWLLTRDQTILAHEPCAFWDQPPMVAYPTP